MKKTMLNLKIPGRLVHVFFTHVYRYILEGEALYDFIVPDEYDDNKDLVSLTFRKQ